jgi:EmrB/QacA subfamily drug resistance transporter
MDYQKQNADSGNNKNLLLFVITLTSIVHPFLGAAVNIALPVIGKEFSMKAVMLGWISMSFLLSSAVTLLPLGKISDIIGRKKIFLCGNIILLLTSVLCAYSISGSMLIIFRVIQGIGSAMIFGTGTAMITSAFPPEERGKAIGFNVSAVYLGLSIAPLIGGLLTQTFGWQSLFIVIVPFSIVIILITVFAIKNDWADAGDEKFDFRGTFIYILALSALMYGFSKLPDPSAIILTLTGIIGLLIFINFELKTAYPVLNITLLRSNRIFAFSNLAALINYAATFAITFLLSLYLQYIKGMSPREAGLLLVTQPAIMTLFASFSGRLSDKYDARIISSAGMSIIVAGLILLTFISFNTNPVFIIFSLLILGMGFGLFSSPNTNAVMSSVEKKYLGVASATVATMRMTGQLMSMGIATLIIHVFMGESQITVSSQSDFMSAFRVSFIFFSILCFFGVFASLARSKQNLNGNMIENNLPK